MIQSMDRKQLEIIDGIKVGDSYVDLHKFTHVKIAEVLQEFELIKVSVDEAVETQITSTFLPHGLGHHLGLHVHDAGGHQATQTGGYKAPPAPHNFLRNTRDIEVGNYFTIEPGLYFIPQLLAQLKEGVTSNGVENYTRMAFAELA